MHDKLKEIEDRRKKAEKARNPKEARKRTAIGNKTFRDNRLKTLAGTRAYQKSLKGKRAQNKRLRTMGLQRKNDSDFFNNDNK